VKVGLVTLEIYKFIWLKVKKLEDTIFSVLEPYLDQWYHVYQGNYYNSVKIAENLLERKVRACGNIRENRGLPAFLKTECRSLKHSESTFR
jgi:hypothetical protein